MKEAVLMRQISREFWLLGLGAILMLLIPSRGWPHNSTKKRPWGQTRYKADMVAWEVSQGVNKPADEDIMLARWGGGRGHGGGFIGPRRSHDEIWRQRYKQWESLPPEEKRLLRERMQEWKKLSPRDRALMRKRYEQWKRLSPEEQIWIRNQLKHWNELSPEEREIIRERFLQ